VVVEDASVEDDFGTNGLLVSRRGVKEAADAVRRSVSSTALIVDVD